MNRPDVELVVRRFGPEEDQVTAIVGVHVDGVELPVVTESPVSLEAGPGPTTLTVTFFVGRVDLVDEEESP